MFKGPQEDLKEFVALCQIKSKVVSPCITFIRCFGSSLSLSIGFLSHYKDLVLLQVLTGDCVCEHVPSVPSAASSN